jgi:hypothetical protein
VRQSHWPLRILFLALAFSLPAVCQTSENCPWLNAATAAGALKGSVTFTVTRSGTNNADATCEFTHQEGAALISLRIQVDTMKNPAREFAPYSAKCGPNAAPLRAIGNEALVCSLRGKNQFSEQVVSRVRERAFIVKITSNLAPTRESDLRERTQKIAEQVAGFLF